MRPAAAVSACERAGRRRHWGTALYQIVVTEMPYQVQKGRLIEKIAALLEEKKLPLLADIRDELTEDVRLVLEPKKRNVDAEMLMEQLFRADRARNPRAAQPQCARSRSACRGS